MNPKLLSVLIGLKWGEASCLRGVRGRTSVISDLTLSLIMDYNLKLNLTSGRGAESTTGL